MDKKLYITTAIPYVNAKPHIGNALDYLLADIWARYQIQNKQEVRFQVGTDEHGNKIASKALAANITPKEYVDQMYGNFENLVKKLDTSYTDFVRTTDENHTKTVQYIWSKLKPYIYKANYQGWYCNGCEAFYTDKEVQALSGACPDHKTNFEQISEENYFFKASAFTDQIRSAILDKSMNIVPEYRANEFLELIKDGVKDVSVSRPKKHLSWGVSVPDDDSQVMYVWLDALANYISILGYPNNPDWKNYWPADIQVVGKDILRFHAGIWPAMLLGLGLELPKCILVHGFISLDGGKISKTVGNTIDPDEIINEYGVDAFRYYFSRHIPTQDDGDFSWQKFENAYNNELGNELGNSVQRVASMINKYQAGVIGELQTHEHDMTLYRRAMLDLEFNKALDEVWLMIRSLSQYIDTVQPWQLAKNVGKDPEAETHLSESLSNCVSAILQISDLLVPFMPNTANKIHATFQSGVIVMPEAPMFPKKYLHTTDPHAPKA